MNTDDLFTTLEPSGDGRAYVSCSWEPTKRYGPFPWRFAEAFGAVSLLGRLETTRGRMLA